MTSPRFARIAAHLLAQDQPASSEPNDARRARAIQKIAEGLGAKGQRRVRRGRAFGLAAIAAASLLGYAGVRKLAPSASGGGSESVSALAKPSGSGTTIWGSAGSRSLVNAAQLQAGGRVVAGNGGGATVRLSTGTELTIERDTTLAFESADRVERFFLSQGVLRAKVAKLSDGQRFIVRTEDAEVEVRGTAFRVEIAPPSEACGGTRTRVSVSEGLVEVRGAGASTYLHPGQSWAADCAVHSVASAAEPPSFAPLSRDTAPDNLTPGGGGLPAEPNAALRAQPINVSARETAPSSIARENELFSRAAAARRQGDRAGAIESLEQLIARYPASPLAESAAVQRMNWLARTDPAAARDAARHYLLRYPRGYAQADAQKLLGQP